MLMDGITLLIQNPMCFIWIIIGVIVGIIFGAIPGLTAAMSIAIFLPITYGLTAIEGISTIIALYIGGISGGLISAILLNMPGTPSSVATCFDGRPLALKGQADKALGAGIVFSFLSTIISIAALVLIAPVLASVALKFGPQEYFAITFLSMSLIITLSSSSLRKGLITGILGIMFATVGLDYVTAVPRFTLGIGSIRSGFSILTVLIGLYAISEVLTTAEKAYDNEIMEVQKDVNMKGFGITMKEFQSQIINFFRSSLIGVAVGILPGIGGGTSNIISYTVAKNQSKEPEKFGTGIVDGVVASEAANNATIGGAMIPLLTLGIPGDAVTAIMLGALAIHGLTPGPLIFEKNGDFIYAIFIVMVIASIVMLIAEFIGLKLFIKVLKVPKNYLLPIIIVLCGVGAFGLNNRIFDMGAMIFFGLIAYVLIKANFPLPPMILGFVLGGTMENNLRSGLSASHNNLFAFLMRPISGSIIIATILFILWSLFSIAVKNKKLN